MNPWLLFAFGTVVTWGVYGIFLHSGVVGMKDPAFGRYKAFLIVGLAYFLTAVIAPLILLWMKGAKWDFPAAASGWSLLAGIVGAAGAFFVLLALGSGNKVGVGPTVIMSIIFAGAPVVNAIVAMTFHPPRGGIGTVSCMFWVGIFLAALGGFLVSWYKPGPGGPPPAANKQAAVEQVDIAAKRYTIR